MKNAAPILNRIALGIALVVGGSSMAIAAEQPMPAENAADMDSEQPVTDTWITTKVKADLATTDGISSTDISVNTTNGVVTLIGVLDSQTGVDKAIAVAKGIKGVVDVDASGLKAK
ncbi:MAG TPA: BON domain-containing protein [Dokdonella sp.]|uniref:BON domain-containing protein n=1 Tax=Dokdonella sp. TaxID=2291710 RepID=UPI002D805815|nr:BON domain-containing protein [Dokdonella sp.]HET9033616.1 BON domain-containing protein [Dokdonella sp.]